jgi:hypothetical protein
MAMSEERNKVYVGFQPITIFGQGSRKLITVRKAK